MIVWIIIGGVMLMQGVQALTLRPKLPFPPLLGIVVPLGMLALIFITSRLQRVVCSDLH